MINLFSKEMKRKGYLFLFLVRYKASVNKHLIYLRSSKIITLPPKVRNSLVLGISWPSFPIRAEKKRSHGNSGLGRRLFGITGKKILGYRPFPRLSLDSIRSPVTHQAEPVGASERHRLWAREGEEGGWKLRARRFSPWREKLQSQIEIDGEVVCHFV